MKRGTYMLEAGLAVVMLAAPLFFGAVYPWAAMPVSALLFVLLAFNPQSILAFFNLPKISRAAILCLSLFLIYQLLLGSFQKYETGYQCLLWLAGGAAYLLIQNLPDSSLRRLMFLLVLLGAAESIYGLWELYSGQGKVLWQINDSYHGFLTGTYVNRNHAAGFFELCLGVHLGLLWDAFRRKKTIAAAFFSLLFLITLAGFSQTGSRMGVGGFFAALIVLLALKGRKVPKPFLATILILSFLTLILGSGILLSRFELVQGLKNFDGGRFLLWKNALLVLKDHPWAGTGLGSFNWIFPSYQSEQFILGWSHVHNDYLELAIELGLPAFLLLTVFFLSLFGALLQKLAAVREDIFPLMWGTFLSVLALLLHGLVDFNFAIPANGILFLMILGFASRLGREA
jgi:O-antigen ligase